MPNYRIVMLPRGSWEVVIKAPDKEKAEQRADEMFDMVTQASDACWEQESIEETKDNADDEWLDEDGDD